MATFIWIHGLPPLFHGFAGKTVTTEMLQSALHHGTQWYASLIQSLLEYDADPTLEERRELGALEKSAFHKQRRQALRVAARRAQNAKALATARDTYKRKFDDMSPREQGLLEDLETGKIEKQRNAHRVGARVLFRGKVRHLPQ